MNVLDLFMTTKTYARSFYNRSKEPWDEEEIEQVKREYDNDMLSIIEIGNIHNRTPGTISFQLKKQNILSKTTDARGYIDYRNSDLYAEIVSGNPNNDKKEKKVKIANNDENGQPKLSKKQIQAGILQEIQEMKKLIQHMIIHLNIPEAQTK
jgi:hypothetical protein